MTDITVSRNNIQQEEVAFRSSVSEGTFTRIGAGINFINDRQAVQLQYNLNGGYEPGAGQQGLEGLYVFHFDGEIAAFSLGNIVAGSSGTTTFDVHRLTSSGVDSGSIFSVKPTIDSTAPNNAYAASNLVDATQATSTGIVLPTFAVTQFNKYEALRFDLDTTMIGAENAFMVLFIRPR